jgi:hypothetical protein
MVLLPATLFAAGDKAPEPRDAETDQSAAKTVNQPVAPDEGLVYRCCTSSGMFPRYVNPDDRPREVAKEGSFCLAVMPSGQHIPGVVCHS